jgi:uncharacterized membrane protein
MAAMKASFGFGTIFSLIVVYFIFKYSQSQGWGILAFVAKWYLIIVGGLIALSIGIVLFILLISFILFALAMLKIKSSGRKKKNKDYIEAEYQIKE